MSPQDSRSRILATKACNALIADAQVDFQRWVFPAATAGIATGNLSFAGAALVAGAVPGVFKRMLNGLWVGGTALLTESDFAFFPNKFNTLLHKELPSIKIPLHSIQSATRRFGFVSGIIEIETRSGVLKIRVFNAESFCALINDAVQQKKSESEVPEE